MHVDASHRPVATLTFCGYSCNGGTYIYGLGMTPRADRVVDIGFGSQPAGLFRPIPVKGTIMRILLPA